MPTDDTPLSIEAFDPSRHGREGFDCGNERLNNYLRLTAKKQQKADLTRVYVATREGESQVLGYSAIALGMMDADALTKKPRGAPRHGELPVLFLGQIAVDRRAQRAGLGSILMHHVFEKAALIAEQAGCFAILLDVMSDGDQGAFERRRGWYGSFGFKSFPSRPSRMFLTLKEVRAILK
jgi:ribosomal protein S18 acetylase RimI-like enzyme